MRVTNQMMSASLLSNLNNLRSRQANLTEQLSSGNRISRNSEDPTAGNEVMRTQSRLQVLSQWESNLEDAKRWVRSSETSLAHMTDLLNRVKGNALIGANGPQEAKVKETLALEVEAMLEDLLTTLNGKQGDSALFGGFQTDTNPFSIDTATGVVTYSGDTGDMQRDVGPGVTITANMHGERFGDWTASDNLLTVVWQTAQDLRNGTADDVRANLDNLDKAVQNVIALRAETGIRDKRIEQIETNMQDTYVKLQEVLQQAQGVEMEKAILDLTSTETTYRAALQVGARVIPPSLADFLR